MNMPTQYKDVADIFRGYWYAYGGHRKLLTSPYLHVALILLIVTFNTWSGLGANSSASSGWWTDSIGILPNLLGFTLGGFAIFTGFGDDKFKAILAESTESSKLSPYVGLCAIFVHFIVVQALALLAAIAAKGLHFYTPLMDPFRDCLPTLNMISGAIGYGLFLYALTLILAATMHVFRIARMYADFQAMQ